MTIWSWPYDALPEVRSFRLRAFNISSTASQTQELIPGGLMVQRWEAKFTMPSSMPIERWSDLDGLFAALAGVGGKVRLWDPARPEPLYNAGAAIGVADWSGDQPWSTGAGWVTGRLPPFVAVGETGSRGATNLLLKGFPASLTAVLRRGDLIEFRPNGIPAEHGMLHQLIGWANSNSSGETRIRFAPGLRRGLRTGDMAVIGGGGIMPSSVFRLAADDEGDIQVSAPFNGSGAFSLIESLPHG